MPGRKTQHGVSSQHPGAWVHVCTHTWDLRSLVPAPWLSWAAPSPPYLLFIKGMEPEVLDTPMESYMAADMYELLFWEYFRYRKLGQYGVLVYSPSTPSLVYYYYYLKA